MSIVASSRRDVQGLVRTTGDAASQQGASLEMLRGRRELLPIFTDTLLLGGGPIDAVGWVPAGSHTSSDWVRGDGTQLATPSYVRRLTPQLPGHMVEVPKEAFHASLRQAERESNAGSTCSYDESSDLTAWHVAGDILGYSAGRVGASWAYWFAIEKLIFKRH